VWCGSFKNRRFGNRIPSIISVTRIGELGTTLAVTSKRSRLRRNSMRQELMWPSGILSDKLRVAKRVNELHTFCVPHHCISTTASTLSRLYRELTGILPDPHISVKPRSIIPEYITFKTTKTKKTPWLLVRERTISTDRPPLVDDFYCQLLWVVGCRVVSAADPLRSLISVF
jgi:hypothetical protein